MVVAVDCCCWEVEAKPVPDAKAAIMAAVLSWFGAPPCEPFEGLSIRGFQLRNAVQILHGFPSGPRTMPGGSDGLEGLEVLDVDDPEETGGALSVVAAIAHAE